MPSGLGIPAEGCAGPIRRKGVWQDIVGGHTACRPSPCRITKVAFRPPERYLFAVVPSRLPCLPPSSHATGDLLHAWSSSDHHAQPKPSSILHTLKFDGDRWPCIRPSCAFCSLKRPPYAGHAQCTRSAEGEAYSIAFNVQLAAGLAASLVHDSLHAVSRSHASLPRLCWHKSNTICLMVMQARLTQS